MSDNEKQHWNAGAVAYMAGKQLEDNPHDPSQPAYDQWKHGFVTEKEHWENL